jgi:Uma2 family endonuclease
MVALRKRLPPRMTVDEFLVWDADDTAGSPCRVITAPGIVPKVRANENFRVPDLGVTCVPPSGSVMTNEPVLLIEILSPSNEAQTRSNVWAYTTVPSVREILLVRSTRMEVELLRRGDDGHWPDVAAVLRPPQALELVSVDFATPVAALYRTAGLTDY